MLQKNIYQASIISTLISVLCSFGVVLFRSGLEQYTYEIIMLLMAAIYVFFSPFIFQRVDKITPSRAVISIIFSIISLYFLWVIGKFEIFMVSFLAIFGIFRGKSLIGSISSSAAAQVLLVSMVFAVYIYMGVNTYGNTTLMTPEMLATGHEHRDVVVRLAFSHIIQSHLALSTGLDGLETTYYHWGFPAFIAALAGISGQNLVALYSFAISIFIGPFAVFSIFAVSAAMQPQQRQVMSMALFGMLLLLGIGYITQSPLFHQPGYVLALGLATLLIPIARGLLSSHCDGRCSYEVGALLVAAILWGIHPSVGLPLSCLVVWSIFRGRKISVLMLLLPTILLLILSILFAYAFYPPPQVSLFIDFNTFMTVYRPHLAGGLIVPAVAIWQRLRSQGAEDRRDVEIISVISAAVFIPPFILDLSFGHNVGYFYGVPTVVLLPFLMGKPFRTSTQFLHTPAAKATVGLLGMVLFQSFHPRLLIADNVAGLNKLVQSVSESDATFALMTSKALLEEHRIWPKDFVSRLADSPGRVMLQTVSRQESLRGNSRLAIFVPPSNAVFWSINRECDVQPYYFPAQTGIPMLSGLPPESCDLLQGTQLKYGLFRPYGEGGRSHVVTDLEVCRRAVMKGFKQVLILDGKESYRSLSC